MGEAFPGLVFEWIPEGVLILSPSLRIMRANPAWEKLSGQREEEVRGLHPWEGIFALSEEGWRASLSGCAENPVEVATELLRPGGATPVEVIAVPFPRGWLLTVRDLRRLKRLEAEARTDAKTGLGNPWLLRAERERLSRTGGTVAMLDVDNLKRINDQFGHATGDRVLREVGRLLRQHTRKDDLAVRFGGDEFLLFLPRTGLREARSIMERMEGLLSRLSAFLELPFPVRVSYGLAELRPGQNLEEAVRTADRDMYRRKRKALKTG